jgi:hypothetical protein
MPVAGRFIIAAQTTKKPAWTGDFVALCYHDVADIPDDPME